MKGGKCVDFTKSDKAQKKPSPDQELPSQTACPLPSGLRSGPSSLSIPPDYPPLHNRPPRPPSMAKPL